MENQNKIETNDTKQTAAGAGVLAKSFFFSVNKDSEDKRVLELAKICEDAGITVCGHDACPTNGTLKGICFLEPRVTPDAKTFENLPSGSFIFGYAPTVDKDLLAAKDLKYVCLSSDEKFIEENNYLTALAQKELLIKRFGNADQKMLLIGHGKLAAQLEKVFSDADIHILNFNKNKVEELKQKYGKKAFFEKAPFEKFPIIINTIPKQLITESDLKKLAADKKAKTAIYELASPPYGFDFGKLDQKKFDYSIEPALPGRFYPDKAALAVFDAIKRAVETQRVSIALCITGSPCSFDKLIPILEGLCKEYNVVPVLSNSADKPNRFIDIEQFKTRLRDICGNNIITTIAGSETLASRKDIVASVVCPATGNTIAKLAAAITDTPVTMAVKALLRNSKPCIIGISTNDALSGNAANIGLLLNRKNYYFIPFAQDDPEKKPFSMIADFAKAGETVAAALLGKQLQPIILK